MRVKICGLMRFGDVSAALNEGADAVGFVVNSPLSPRNLNFSRARRLMKSVGVFSTKVVVTSSGNPRGLFKICERIRPDALQLHYHTPQLIRLLRKERPDVKLILATQIRDESSLKRAEDSSRYADATLTDSPSATRMGGTGRVHDWGLTTKVRDAIYPHPLILAGGLTVSNVATAIAKVRPYGVDVSSGVERRIGVKDHEEIRRFIMKAKEAAS